MASCLDILFASFISLCPVASLRFRSSCFSLLQGTHAPLEVRSHEPQRLHGFLLGGIYNLNFHSPVNFA